VAQGARLVGLRSSVGGLDDSGFDRFGAAI